MAIQKREVQYAKEVDDVAVLLVHIVAEARSGKSPGDIASGAVAKLIDALGGIDGIGSELASARKVVLQTLGYRVGELADAILGSEPGVVPVAEV